MRASVVHWGIWRRPATDVAHHLYNALWYNTQVAQVVPLYISSNRRIYSDLMLYIYGCNRLFRWQGAGRT